MSSDEELTLVRLYVSKIPQLCGAFKFVEEVEATAETFLKRFYLKNTVMDWHPKNVMLTALFLAAKTANSPIAIETYTSRIPKTQPSDVLELEFLVAQSLDFEFTVWHAHRALWGLGCAKTVQDPPADLYDIYRKALEFIRKARLTDCEFIYTPSQIALAAIHELSAELAMRWAVTKGMDEATANRICKDISSVVEREVKVIDVEAVREVDRRLRTCKNPEKTAGSVVYESKKAAEVKRASERKDEKLANARQAMENEDPFGGNLSVQGRVTTLGLGAR